MPRQASKSTVEAMELVLDGGLTPYGAAKQLHIDISSLYKGKLYRLYKAGELAELRQAMAEIRARSI